MKNLLLPIVFLIAISSSITAQVTISYNKAKLIDKVTFGYRAGEKVTPYIGFQYAGASFTYEETGNSKDEVSVSAFMPNLGVKYYMLSKENLKAGINLGVFIPIINFSDEDDFFYDDLQNNSLFLGELSFLSEYYLNPSFSIGGEFGFRFIKSKAEFKDSNSTFKYGTNLNFTFTSFSLNYHF